MILGTAGKFYVSLVFQTTDVKHITLVTDNFCFLLVHLTNMNVELGLEDNDYELS